MRVRVYRNLHKHCYSIVAMQGPDKGRVVAHANTVLLHDAVFKVSEKGRQRVLKEKRKNVHAFVVGEWKGPYPVLEESVVKCLVPVTYNPYKYKDFVTVGSERPVRKAKIVYLNSCGIKAHGVEYHKYEEQLEMDI